MKNKILENFCFSTDLQMFYKFVSSRSVLFRRLSVLRTWKIDEEILYIKKYCVLFVFAAPSTVFAFYGSIIVRIWF